MPQAANHNSNLAKRPDWKPEDRPMPARDHLARAESALRAHALAYPETYEEFPWGHRAIKINGKVFVFLYREDGFLGLTVKLPVSGRSALTLPFASPTGYGMGKHGWVSAKFGPADAVPTDMIKEWIDESFRAIAPKKLLARMEKEKGTAAPKTLRKKKA
jgi:predicted DNA-binding protein (MmcQ/YjbR family)